MLAMPVQEGLPTRAIWLIGEALGENEERTGRPFSGAAGAELNDCLRAAGIARSQCFITNVCHARPPTRIVAGKPVTNDLSQWFAGKLAARRDAIPLVMGRYPLGPVVDGLAHLRSLLAAHRPAVIIALGGTALWALTGHADITKWRGSELATPTGIKVIPTFHPAATLRQYAFHRIVVHDMRRALREASYPELRTTPFRTAIARTPDDVADWLAPYIIAKTPLICDTEGWSAIDCIGFATDTFATGTPGETLCIPLCHLDGSGSSYWTPDDEVAVTTHFLAALAACPITFHRGLWDIQLLTAWYGQMPRFTDDTMLMQHVLWPSLLGGRIDPITGATHKGGSSLSLSFCSSMYCAHHRYWKDDGRLFDAATQSEDDFWQYNCEDTARTAEIAATLRAELHSAGLWDQYRFQMSLFEPVFAMMAQGLRIDAAHLREDAAYIAYQREEIQSWLNEVTDSELNVHSNLQIHDLFYNLLLVDKIRHRKTKQPTVDDGALGTIARRNPLLRPLVRQIQNLRSLDTEDSFLSADRLSADGRFRFQLDPSGTETMRFSSSQDAFGEGANVQNWPRPVSD